MSEKQWSSGTEHLSLGGCPWVGAESRVVEVLEVLVGREEEGCFFHRGLKVGSVMGEGSHRI